MKYYDLINIEKNNYYKNNLILKELKKDLKEIRINHKLIKFYLKQMNKKENEKKYFYYMNKILTNENLFLLIKFLVKYEIKVNPINYKVTINKLINSKKTGNYSLLEYQYNNTILLCNRKIKELEKE